MNMERQTQKCIFCKTLYTKNSTVKESYFFKNDTNGLGVCGSPRWPRRHLHYALRPAPSQAAGAPAWGPRGAGAPPSSALEVMALLASPVPPLLCVGDMAKHREERPCLQPTPAPKSTSLGSGTMT